MDRTTGASLNYCYFRKRPIVQAFELKPHRQMSESESKISGQIYADAEDFMKAD